MHNTWRHLNTIIRHNRVAGYINWTICKHMGLQVTDRYYERISERVIDVNGTTIMWDVPVITDRTILVNRPDIALHDTEKDKSCLLIDIAMPDDSDLNKATKKLSRYKNCAGCNWSIRND
jgi:hypothetical protein